jgi:hypothetical protein
MPATANVGGFKMRHKDACMFLVGSLPSIFGVASLQTRHKRLSFSASFELDFEGLAVD